MSSGSLNERDGKLSCGEENTQSFHNQNIEKHEAESGCQIQIFPEEVAMQSPASVGVDEATPDSATAASEEGLLTHTPTSSVAETSAADQPAATNPARPSPAASPTTTPVSSATPSSPAAEPPTAPLEPPSQTDAPPAAEPPTAPPEPPSQTDATPVAEPEEPARVALPSPASPPPAPAAAHVSDTAHHIKWVQFHGARSPIITQNVNGPCPLLALINVMLLKGKLQLPAALEVITIGQLMDYIGDTMLDSAPADDPAQQPDFQQNMQDAVAILPNLQTGLDVNVKFSGVQEFEYTPELCIFDLLHVRLYHGWLAEPGEPDVQRAVAQCGYNQLVDKIITNKSSDDPELSHQALLAETFLESSASQLTVHGLSQLRSSMRDGELAVFFRNNHFSTIYRCQDTLYLLVTDQGFLREPRVVWETLSSTDGAGQFVDGQFEPLSPESAPPAATVPSPQQVDQDYLVALSLQEESSRQQAHDIQWEEYKQAEFGSGADVLSDAELARRLQNEEERGAREEQQQQQQRQQQQQQQQQPAPRQQRLDSSSSSSSSRPEGKRKNCAVM